MVRREKDIRKRIVKQAQGGKSEVAFFEWLLPEEAPGHGRVFSKLVIPPGSSIGYHEHEGEFEAYLVLSGEATVDDNGEQTVLHAGDMSLCRSGEGHSTENNGTENLILLALIMNCL